MERGGLLTEKLGPGPRGNSHLCQSQDKKNNTKDAKYVQGPAESCIFEKINII